EKDNQTQAEKDTDAAAAADLGNPDDFDATLDSSTASKASRRSSYDQIVYIPTSTAQGSGTTTTEEGN
ncbi:MAG: hypothetical protein E6Z30_06520, partial [Atopobium minutum]|nr:hypothetical protein [Atopobium minutum]